MMPEGIKAMGEAVELIKAGVAPKWVQPEEGATYEPHISAKPELARIDWSLPATDVSTTSSAAATKFPAPGLRARTAPS